MKKHSECPTDDLYFQAARHVDHGELNAARTVLDTLLVLEPDRPDALLMLSQVHGRLGNQCAEITLLLRLADVMPLDVDLSIRLGTLYFDIHQHVESIGIIEQALDSIPDGEGLLDHYIFLLRVTRNRDLAIERLNQKAELPLSARTKFQRSLIHLAEGRLMQGWQDFDQRHLLDRKYSEPVNLKRWQGESFKGQTLLVTSEGGYGDQIWAARFLPHARSLGGTVCLETPSALRKLFSQLEGVDELFNPDGLFEEFDYFCPILSLPVCLNVEDPVLYRPARLTVSHDLNPRLSDQLEQDDDHFRVGIIWSGSETYSNNHHRAAPLECFLPLLTVPGTRFFSLQKGPQQEQLRHLGYGDLIQVADDGDFSETAALVKSLDLIIMTDTAIAHLAGSLGIPVWNVVDHSPYWYFDAAGECEWYPSMRLFRQSRPGDWRSVFEIVREELSCVVAQRLVK